MSRHLSGMITSVNQGSVRHGTTRYSLFSTLMTLYGMERTVSPAARFSQRNPPYFVKQFQNSTTDDIEARICLDEPWYENIAVELVELYVQ